TIPTSTSRVRGRWGSAPRGSDPREPAGTRHDDGPTRSSRRSGSFPRPWSPGSGREHRARGEVRALGPLRDPVPGPLLLHLQAAGPGHAPRADRIAQEREDRARDRARLLRDDEPVDAVLYDLAKRRDVAGDDRTPRGPRLEIRLPEGLVARGHREDRRERARLGLAFLPHHAAIGPPLVG